MHMYDWIDNFDFLLFDLDGLLVDTERLHFKAYQEMCLKHGCSLPWSFSHYCGVAHLDSKGLREQICKEFPSLQEMSWEELYAEKKAIHLSLLQSGALKLMPGVSGLLNAICKRQMNSCVVTNSSRVLVETIQKALPALKRIPNWVVREDYAKPKPEPDGYLKAIELYGQKLKKIVGFEDSFRGLQALVKAGVNGVLISHEDHPQMTLVDKSVPVFSSFTKIPELFGSSSS